MRRLSAYVGLLLLGACSGGLRDGQFARDNVRYRVAAPPEAGWRRVSFAGNDLAWTAKGSGHLIALNAVCQDHGDPSLEVLTTHLLFGFDERTLTARKHETIDGRAALRSLYEVSIDGVPAEVEVVVLKKNGCVHDFTYVSPRGARATAQSTFDALVAGFAQESAP